MAMERDQLGEKITQWLHVHPGVEIVDKILVETAAKCVRRKRGNGSFFPARMG